VTEIFEVHRPRLLAIAYGMVGSIMDAEDIVQEAWFRWNGTDRAAIREPGAYLTTVVTRLAIDRLRSARYRRETYVGPWLPEPLVREVDSDPADVVVEAESLSLALLATLERLNPVERAVFLLREIFDFDYAEIADVVEKSPSACRQIAVRARDHVGDPTRKPPATPDMDVLSAFTVAMATGDIGSLVELLAADAILWSDGGAERRAARHPIIGPRKIAAFLVGIARRGLDMGATGRPVLANGAPALLLELEGTVYGVMALEIVDSAVLGVRSVINPDKLAHIGRSAL